MIFGGRLEDLGWADGPVWGVSEGHEAPLLRYAGSLVHQRLIYRQKQRPTSWSSEELGKQFGNS